jgi:hypothetical protein
VQKKFLKRKTMNRILLLALIFISCNPVKKILRDREMFDEVAKEVVKAGYCANDTIILTKSDTTIQVDTLTLIDKEFDVKVYNDTTYITQWQTKYVNKNVIIRDTVKSVVVDNARIKLLQEDLLKANEEKLNWKERANKTFGYLLLLICGIGVYLFLKFKK